MVSKWTSILRCVAMQNLQNCHSCLSDLPAFRDLNSPHSNNKWREGSQEVCTKTGLPLGVWLHEWTNIPWRTVTWELVFISTVGSIDLQLHSMLNNAYFSPSNLVAVLLWSWLWFRSSIIKVTWSVCVYQTCCGSVPLIKINGHMIVSEKCYRCLPTSFYPWINSVTLY